MSYVNINYNTIKQEEPKMSTQKLHAFEKTAIQARMAIKRLEAVLDNRRSTDSEKKIASVLLDLFGDIRSNIPKEFIDVDLKE